MGNGQQDRRSARVDGAPLALSHTNRKGNTYSLHQRTTKTGKPRYFVARSIGDNPLGEMPNGLEVTESINGVVSVRRKQAGKPSGSDATAPQ
jgi:hypothetical protein